MKTRQNIIALAFDKRGRLLSYGRNNYTKTHPLQKMYADKVGIPQKIYLHAEIDCLSKLRNHKVHRMVIIRQGKEGALRPSKPCPVCLAAIKDFGIKHLEYTE